jgi:hypothetical protein
VENIYKWPHNTWPKTKEEKLRGAFTFRNLGENVSGLSMALLTRKGGWSTEQVEVLLAEVGKNFRDRKIHGYFKV